MIEQLEIIRLIAGIVAIVGAIAGIGKLVAKINSNEKRLDNHIFETKEEFCKVDTTLDKINEKANALKVANAQTSTQLTTLSSISNEMRTDIKDILKAIGSLSAKGDKE